MSGLEFAAPERIHVLWAVLVLIALLIWLDRRGTQALNRFVSAALSARLVRRPGVNRRRARLALMGTALVAMNVALMRPQWGSTVVSTPRSGAEIMIALDVSRSMLAEDVVPNRLARAKAEVGDLLPLLDGDQVGLIAFAGRATVLSPLTPDFGFVRLALNDALPGIVGRGGTRLEEPIRKAVAGFGNAGNVSRSILLITDGEDHDSFPLEAARAAAERGVRILAIGFGDEAGAEIVVTDPRSGARAPIRDSDGQVVRSRLDGDLLRELARVTGGAYIPAGTGLLDLKAIHAAHIAPLTRGKLDGRERIVKNDVYQWPLLLALLALLGAVASTARVSAPREPAAARGVALGIVFSLACLVSATLPWPLAAQTPAATGSVASAGAPSDVPAPPGGAAASGSVTGPTASDGQADPDQQPPPRRAYNDALVAMGGEAAQAPGAGGVPSAAVDLDRAERLFESARVRAAQDAEVRYRATYNLGWVAIKRADALLAEEPAKALEQLQVAGRWFAEAIRLRPEAAAARLNLDLTMRRAMQLADQLAAEEARSLVEALDALIDRQRGFMAQLAETVSGTAADEIWTGEQQRRQLRTLATGAIEVLGETQTLEVQANREARTAAGAAADADGNALERAQLEAVSAYLLKAGSRLAQSRTRLRRGEPAAAYRRAARALGELQRARDQLRAPVERLDALMASGRQLTQLTTLASGGEPAQRPVWLSDRFLETEQADLEARTLELETGFTAALAEAPAGTAPPSSHAQPGGPTPDSEDAAASAMLRRQLAAASPQVADAARHFASARAALAEGQPATARPDQGRGLLALDRAREAFLDRRRLIDKIVAVERQVASALQPPPAADSDGPAEASTPMPAPGQQASTTPPPSSAGTPGETSGSAGIAPPAPASTSALKGPELGLALAARNLHVDNIERLDRLGGMLEDESPSDPDATASAADAEQAAALREQARALWSEAGTRMAAATAPLTELASAETAAPAGGAGLAAGSATPDAGANRLAAARHSVGAALTTLEALRRLFFSVLEHLRETAQRQSTLIDDTQVVAVLKERLTPEALTQQAGPLGHRQGRLAEISAQIASALQEQAQAQAQAGAGAPAAGPGAAKPTPPGAGAPSAPGAARDATTPGQAAPGAGGPSAEQLTEAASLVTTAQTAMRRAAAALDTQVPPLPDARSEQDTALEQLLAAIALLSPPPPPPEGDEQAQENEAGERPEEGQDEQPQQGSLSQLLQGIRDREAERREKRSQHPAGGVEAVEKDW